MAKKSTGENQDYDKQISKAVRRGEKFAKTLGRIAAHSDASDPVQALLKSVQKGLEKLRRRGANDRPDDYVGTSKKEARKAKSALFHSQAEDGAGKSKIAAE